MCHGRLFSVIVASNVFQFLLLQTRTWLQPWKNDSNRLWPVPADWYTTNESNGFNSHSFYNAASFFTHLRTVGNCHFEKHIKLCFKNCIWHWFNSMVWNRRRRNEQKTLFFFCLSIPLKYYVRSVGRSVSYTLVDDRPLCDKMSLTIVHGSKLFDASANQTQNGIHTNKNITFRFDFYVYFVWSSCLWFLNRKTLWKYIEHRAK